MAHNPPRPVGVTPEQAREIASEIARRPKPPLVLKWRHTWPTKGPDFSCSTAAGLNVGRIYHYLGTDLNPPHWYWCTNGYYRGHWMNGRGQHLTKRGAAEAVEDDWFRRVAAIDAKLGPETQKARPA